MSPPRAAPPLLATPAAPPGQRPASLRRRRHAGGRTPRGAALLAAMLTVALVATLSAAALWQQWRGIEVEAAERSRAQSAWLLTGALDWSRLILRQDALSAPQVDHLSEPWAMPLAESRLSAFLAGTPGATDTDLEREAFLSGQIRDAQGRLNVGNLSAGGRLNTDWLLRFQRLFELLGLPAAELNALAQGMVAAQPPLGQNAPDGATPLPQSVDQLAWLGLSAPTIEALRPYVSVIATATPLRVNLNTAPAEVIYAAGAGQPDAQPPRPGLDLASARALVEQRQRSFLRDVTVASMAAGGRGEAIDAEHFDVRSSYFEVRGRLRLDDLALEEVSLLHRSGTQVSTLSRHRTALTAGPADAQDFSALRDQLSP